MRHEGSVGQWARELHDNCRQTRSTDGTQPNRVYLAERGDHLWVKFNVDPRLSGGRGDPAASVHLNDATVARDWAADTTASYLHYAM